MTALTPPIAPLPHERHQTLADLRRLLPRLESGAAKTRAFSFGIPEVDDHLPQGGLASGAVHEVAPVNFRDTPAALGFTIALLGRMRGSILLITAPRGLADHGRLYGHGLSRLGLDPARLVMVEAADDKQAHWAMEESLRSRVPAVVAGAIGASLDLRTSQRLQLAAGDSGIPLLLLHPANAEGSNAAMTRWRIAAAAAARDRFGLVERWRWRVTLERSRNGRPGEWVLEYDDAYRFRLAAAMADPALPRRAGAPSLAHAG
jgi:protein ImuA